MYTYTPMLCIQKINRECILLGVHFTCFQVYFLTFLMSRLQLKEMHTYLQAEKSSRSDLEMYVAVLNTQRNVLQDETEKFRKELHEGTCMHNQA
jgi:hypothetical protein